MLLKDLLQEYIFECQIRKFTFKTIKGYRNNCDYLFSYLDSKHNIISIDDVKTTHLKQFIMWQTQKGCKGSYINGLLKSFRAFFKYAYNEEYIQDNTVIKLKWSKEEIPTIKTFTDDEVKRMINVFSGNDYISIRNKAIIYFLFDTGIRNNELCILPNQSIKQV